MSARASSPRNIAPVFVIGSPRSGTTMLGSMLGSHSRGLAIHESRFFSEMAPTDPNEIVSLAAIVDRFVEERKFKAWDLDLAGRRPRGEGRYADAVLWLVERFAEHRGRTGIRFWIDHDPAHTPSVTTLAAHFPQAKFIHLVRDGRAVAASLMATRHFGPDYPLNAARFWTHFVALGMAAQRFLPADRFVEMRYEALVRDPETALEPVLARLGHVFEPDMPLGRGYEVPKHVAEIELHPNVGRAPDPARIDGWRRKLTGRDLEIFEAYAGDLLPMLGYVRVHARPRPITGAEDRAFRWKGQIKRLRARLGLGGSNNTNRRPLPKGNEMQGTRVNYFHA